MTQLYRSGRMNQSGGSRHVASGPCTEIPMFGVPRMNDLIPADVYGEVSTQVASDDDFASMESGGFLRRIDLKSKGKLIDIGKVKPGHYCVVKSSDDADDLGDSIDILPLARRPKAIDMNDIEQIVVTYDRGSDLFADIEKRSSQRDSHCQFGASFLVVERSTGQLYELFLGSASNRREVGTISDFLPLTEADIKRRKLKDTKPHGPLTLTLKSKRIENKAKGWSWFVIVPKPCSNNFTKDQIPSTDVLKDEIGKFLNPDDGNKPQAEPQKEGKKSRAR